VDGLRRQFAQNLREQRHRANLSQEELAHLAELDRTAISLLERGLRMPRLDTIVKLSRALRLGSPAELLGGII
jgi:transcriptional regulator with XRE-family HTH domain